jgi:U3 small nucleolar RNA-associated protein 14
MKRVKEAEHLSFPLQGAERGGVKSSGEMLADYKPSGEHESAVHALLARANLTEKGVKQVEDDALQGQDLSMEEIKARRDQLRVQRELMFREEAKSKRVSKIKSKTFRKLARRRAAKEGEEDLEAMDEEDAAEVREKMERQRAKERATLRHGAKTGRWAREADGGGFDNDDKRRAKEEMLEMKEKLRRRIEGKGDEDDSDGSDEDSGEEEADETTIKARAFDQLDKLGQNTEPDAADKGLMQMAFMQKARERERQKVNEMEETTRRDIELFGDEEASAEEDEDEGKANMMTVNGNEGRMVFSGPVPVSPESAIPKSLHLLTTNRDNRSKASPRLYRPRLKSSILPNNQRHRQPKPLLLLRNRRIPGLLHLRRLDHRGSATLS